LQDIWGMKKYSQPVQRKPRTDALRNQKRILEAAKGAFTRYGADASLDDIAKQAGVGAGTLYRHFPTRDALIEAVYRSEVEKLAAASSDAPDRGAARLAAAVRRLLRGQTYYCARPPQRGRCPSRIYEGSRSLVQGAIEELVKRAKKSGDVRRDIDAFDLLRAVIGVSYVGPGGDWQQSAKRLIEILIVGSRPAE
jgi:AcrR family transcriptional regulator